MFTYCVQENKVGFNLGLLIVVGNQSAIPPDVSVQNLKATVPGKVVLSYIA